MYLVGRRIGQLIRLNKLLSFYRGFRPYEEEFEKAFLESIREGDVVWDVGANVGYYTSKIADRLNDRGMVFGFEPSRCAFSQLVTALQRYENFSGVNVALGRVNYRAKFVDKGLGDPTNHIFTGMGAAGDNIVEIDIRAGDWLVSEGDLPIPDVIKLDVEGFEIEVLEGMTSLLADQKVRVIAIEVHFQLLQRRYGVLGPRRILELLRSKGFSYVQVDSSHAIFFGNSLS